MANWTKDEGVTQEQWSADYLGHRLVIHRDPFYDRWVIWVDNDQPGFGPTLHLAKVNAEIYAEETA